MMRSNCSEQKTRLAGFFVLCYSHVMSNQSIVELIEKLLEAKRRRSEECLRVATDPRTEVPDVWFARASESRIFATDLEMLLEIVGGA